LKPSGEVFINKVFDEWWTNETGTTDENGLFQPRAFKGDYIITVSQGEQIFEVLVNAIDDMQVDIETDFTSSTLDPVLQEIEVYPNPSNGRFQIKLPNHLIQVSLDIFDVTGKLIISKPSISQTDEIILDKNGLYQMRFVSGNNIGFKSVFVNF
jgi:hypothetical protein